MPRYVNESQYRHDTPERLGVLLTNLGTPDAPTAGDVRRYLAEFLRDPRVVELPRALWLPILHGIILRIRPRRSAAAYAEVWGDDGSPLLAIANRQRDAMRQLLEQRFGERCVVELAMRYGNPSIESVLDRMRQQNVRRLVLLPLYPQYSATTTASTFDELTRVLSGWRWLPELRVVNQYHDEPGYIGALCASLAQYREAHGAGDRLLFSFHGIPKRYLLNGDPYHCQCHKTARLCAERLGLAEGEWAVSFQSRLGREEWLRPYTDEVLEEWGKSGTNRVDVMCPGFSADCLETLEEVAMQYRELFVESGGGELHYVPALNDRDDHMQFLADLAMRHTAGWPESDGETRHDPQKAAALARAMGAER